ncbi:hypothetical protein M434DRAFT_35764 [Hypoxylon sp. CO27-5]|nr:hypothetical protein M434DRAFT_35764 [Hypoxylon sp. CO27-5]
MAPKYVRPEALGGRVAYGACREKASELIITGRSSIRGLPEGITKALFWPASHKAPQIHKTLPRLAFGLLKGNPANTAPAAVSFVSDQDFSLRKTFHIINLRPPPPASTEVA